MSHLSQAIHPLSPVLSLSKTGGQAIWLSEQVSYSAGSYHYHRHDKCRSSPPRHKLGSLMK